MAVNSSYRFVKPLEETHSFTALLDQVIKSTSTSTPEVWYAQTQNSNLRDGEYITLFPSIPPTLFFARIALQKDPDAVNLWIGNEKSVTALHKDNYENIFVQVAGEKHFVLIPPVGVAGVGEKFLDVGKYARREDGELDVVMEEGEKVPFATWDPDDPRPGEEGSKYSRLLKPMRVTLKAGDMLYLPAMW